MKDVIFTVRQLRDIVKDLPDDTVVFTNFGPYHTGIYDSKFTDYGKDKIKTLLLKHTMSNCKI